MNKEDFTLGNKEYYIEDEYVFTCPEYIMIISKNIFDVETVKYANEIAKKYKE